MNKSIPMYINEKKNWYDEKYTQISTHYYCLNIEFYFVCYNMKQYLIARMKWELKHEFFLSNNRMNGAAMDCACQLALPTTTTLRVQISNLQGKMPCKLFSLRLHINLVVNGKNGYLDYFERWTGFLLLEWVLYNSFFFFLSFVCSLYHNLKIYLQS